MPETHADSDVIDLRGAPGERVRVDRHNNPFTALSKPERMKLIIRVLCEIVAYGEDDDADDPKSTLTPKSTLAPKLT